MTVPREHWSSRLGFILAAAGSAIGLGTLWKFPYVTGEHGGGLFVLVYIICTFFIGIPVFIAELTLGRRAQRAPVGIFSELSGSASPWKAVGWLGVISSFLIMSYYSVIGGWGINYTLMSLSESYKGATAEQIAKMFATLESSGDISVFWHFIFTAIVVAVVYPGVRQGLEYWSKFMTSGLLILLVILFLFSTTLDGFMTAVRFIFTPDFSKFKASGILEALGLSFFTLSLGQGIMLTYGSYMRSSEDIPKTGFIIGFMIIFAALLASLMIFPVIFTFGFAPEGGRGLIFKTLPLLFSKLPGSLIISTTFFTLFVFAALTSAMAFVEVVSATLIESTGWSRKRCVILVGIACFIVGIPSALSGSHTLFANWDAIFGKTFFATVDDLVSIWFLPLGGLFVSIYAGWFFDLDKCKQEYMSGTSLKWFWQPWRFLIRWVAPLAILAIMLQQGGLINIDSVLKMW